MQYQVSCECGEFVTVAEAAAGTSALCSCGRTVVIPSYRELRAKAGLREPSLPPEVVVEALLLAGKLPEDDHCILCDVATDAILCIETECERAYVQSGLPSWWVYLLGFISLITFGLLGVAVIGTGGDDREWGKDRVYRLPLRVCATCTPRLTEAAEIIAALCRVPVYRRLLTKYPRATISVVGT